jgi:hypothetical protein
MMIKHSIKKNRQQKIMLSWNLSSQLKLQQTYQTFMMKVAQLKEEMRSNLPEDVKKS